MLYCFCVHLAMFAVRGSGRTNHLGNQLDLLANVFNHCMAHVGKQNIVNCARNVQLWSALGFSDQQAIVLFQSVCIPLMLSDRIGHFSCAVRTCSQCKNNKRFVYGGFYWKWCQWPMNAVIAYTFLMPYYLSPPYIISFLLHLSTFFALNNSI